MAKERASISYVSNNEDETQPQLLPGLMPGTKNRIPMCVGKVYQRIDRGAVPYYVRSRVIPTFEPAFGIYDTDLGIVTPAGYPRPMARYSQDVFGRLQRGQSHVARSILAQIYAVTTLVAREIIEHPRLDEYIESKPIYLKEEKGKLVRRAGWQAASRLAIDAVITDHIKKEDITRQMRFVANEIEWDYQDDSLAGNTLAQKIDPMKPKRFGAPVELVASVSPFSSDDMAKIFPK